MQASNKHAKRAGGQAKTRTKEEVYAELQQVNGLVSDAVADLDAVTLSNRRVAHSIATMMPALEALHVVADTEDMWVQEQLANQLESRLVNMQWGVGNWEGRKEIDVICSSAFLLRLKVPVMKAASDGIKLHRKSQNGQCSLPPFASPVLCHCTVFMQSSVACPEGVHLKLTAVSNCRQLL